MNTEFIFSEFGSRSTANQPNTFTDEHRLDPTYSSVKKYFPEAKLTLYTDIEELGKNYPLVFVFQPMKGKWLRLMEYTQGGTMVTIIWMKMKVRVIY